MRTSAEFLSDLEPVIDRIAGGPVSAQVKPLFQLQNKISETARHAIEHGNRRYDAGFNAGEHVGFQAGVRKGRADCEGYVVQGVIVGICIGAVVGAGAALAGFFV